MSTALGIASATYVLRALIDKGLKNSDSLASIGDVTVSLLAPDLMDVSQSGSSQLNLFMYMVTPNNRWSNDELPSINSGGNRIKNPSLAINLHYILTAYSSTELHAEILLGNALQILHEAPVLSRDYIRQVLNSADMTALATSGLADQFEQIKIVPEASNSEEISKLWGAFQAKYRPSCTYVASVVLIESKKSTKAALPVKQRLLYVEPFKRPLIEEIHSKKAIDQPELEMQKILDGYYLAIKGKLLDADLVYVMVGDQKVTLLPGDINQDKIICQLPAGISAGITGVRVIHEKLIGSPPLPHQGEESNVYPIVICPEIENQTKDGITNTSGDYHSGNILIEVKPDITSKQRVTLFMNENTSVSPNSYSFQMPPLEEIIPAPALSTDEISIPIKNVKAGTYLLRLQVDGAESPLTSVAGSYVTPSIIIP